MVVVCLQVNLGVRRTPTATRSTVLEPILDGIAVRPSSVIGAEKIVTNLYARSVFFVADADRSLRYYTEQLGFSLDWDSKDGVFQVSLFGFELIINQVGDRTRTRA